MRYIDREISGERETERAGERDIKERYGAEKMIVCAGQMIMSCSKTENIDYGR